MGTKKNTTTKAKATSGKNGGKTKQVEKVAGKFKAGSDVAKMFEFLSDGKSHTQEEVIKHVKPASGRIKNKAKKILEWGHESGQFEQAIHIPPPFMLSCFSTHRKAMPMPHKMTPPTQYATVSCL